MVFSDLFFLFVFLPTFALSYLTATWIDRQRQGGHAFANAVLPGESRCMCS